MTEAEIRAYVIADNKLAENAGWDRNLLALELQYLSDLGLDDLDVTITGFELPEIVVLMDELTGANNDDSADDVIEPTPGRPSLALGTFGASATTGWSAVIQPSPKPIKLCSGTSARRWSFPTRPTTSQSRAT